MIDASIKNLVKVIKIALPKRRSRMQLALHTVFLHLGAGENLLWSIASQVGQSVLERFQRLQPAKPLTMWFRNLPFDLLTVSIPLALCLHHYLAIESGWSRKLGTLSGHLVSLIVAVILAFVILYAPINVALYAQDRGTWAEPFYRTVRGISGIMMLLWWPSIFVWFWWLNKSGTIPWLTDSWSVVFGP